MKRLRELGVDVVWLVETEHRGISDEGVVDLANRLEAIVLTRDRDFVERSGLRRKARSNLESLARNIVRALELLKSLGEGSYLIIVRSSFIELQRLA